MISKHKRVRLKHYDGPEALIEYSNNIQDIYKNIEEYSLWKKWKIFIAFDDTVADMIDNIKLNQVVTELFIRGRKLNISVIFITQLYLCQKILG